MSLDISTPQRAAIQIYRFVEAFSKGQQTPLFPINVEQVALGIADLFEWKDPIAAIESANIPGFEGALIPNERGDKWMMLYNQSLTGGRVRFTMAHELGHYVLHRLKRKEFQCNQQDMLNLSHDDKNIETEAHIFASYLLMPLEDYRKQFTSTVDFDVLGACALRYGVSLTAATLKWLDHTEEKAVLVMHNDGYINWWWASDAAKKAGAFFKTSKGPIEVPPGSVAAEETIRHERSGISIPLSTWWPNAEEDTQIRELKISADQYDSVLTLLILPRHAKAWPKWQGGV